MTFNVLHAFAEPEIAARAKQALLGAAAAGSLVGIASLVVPRHAAARSVLLPLAWSGFAYLLLGLACRFVVQHHRSRLQMVLLLAAVAGAEIIRSRRTREGRPHMANWLVGSIAVCLGVVAAKWALEPGALSASLSRLQFLGGNA